MALGDPAIIRLREQLVRPALPPRYEPLEVIGRGGMGAVWRVRDHLLEREVAVKVLAESVADAGIAQRLAHEAAILARLEHPGIVAVHDAGELDDGRTWYAMRLVRGTRLDAPAARPHSIGDVLRTMAKLAETVGYAHEHGVIHRDLKPGNIMVGPFGELLVLDWGVAQVGAAPPDARAVGTPGYMAPEQAAGGVADARSDVYGLGAILRDLLGTVHEPVPAPLTAIQARAMAERPGARYQSAAALADDLRCFQDGLPVAAYREGPFERLGRVLRPYWGAIALVVAYIVMRLAVLVWKGI